MKVSVLGGLIGGACGLGFGIVLAPLGVLSSPDLDQLTASREVFIRIITESMADATAACTLTGVFLGAQVGKKIDDVWDRTFRGRD